jgi:membrane-associated protease RseP (regulator of RpoE activity)
MPGPAATRTGEIAWLGIALGDVPEALYAQLEQIIPPGQGVLVTAVMPDSPASKAGIHTNDVLLAFGDQKLYSPRQLVGLVRADQPGQTVAIQLVAQGKLQTLQVTLDKRSQAASMPPYRPYGWRTPMRHHRHMPHYPPMSPWGGPSNRPLAWSEFESLQVSTLPDGHYRAEVTYKDNENNSKQFSFEGTQEQIRNEIQKNDSLPEDKKQALLEALNMNPDRLFKPPMFEDYPYNDSFFQDNPFEEDFFRDFPPMYVPPGFPPFFQPSAP